MERGGARRLRKWPAHGLPAVLLVCVGAATVPADPDWTQWGGAARDFIVEDAGIAERWPDPGPRVLWRRLLGPGHSAILARAGALYTLYRSGPKEVIVSLDAASGATRWEHRYPAPFLDGQATQFGEGPNATPLIAGPYLVSVGFTSIVQCVLHESGKPVWSRDLVREFGATPLHFGYAASPILHGGMVIVLAGGKHAALGFDLASGKLRWSGPPLAISYASPLLIDVDGEEQLVFMTPTEVVGIAMSDGKLRWRFEHENQFRSNCVGPWWGEDDTLFVSSQGTAGSRTLKLTRAGESTVVEELVRDRKMRIFHNSVVRVDEVIYGGSHDWLVAYDLRAGRTLWREAGFSEASVVRVGQRMIVLGEEGNLALASMTRAGMTLHSEARLMNKPAWTVPTVSGDRLYARDNLQILAVDLGVGPQLADPN